MTPNNSSSPDASSSTAQPISVSKVPFETPTASSSSKPAVSVLKKIPASPATPTTSSSSKSIIPPYVYTPLAFTSTYKPSLSTPRASTSSAISKDNYKPVLLKKKLEFAAKKHLEEEEMNYEGLTQEELKKLIVKRTEQLNILERHEAEKKELTEITEKWKDAGNEAVDELAAHFNCSREEVMKNLHISEDLFE